MNERLRNGLLNLGLVVASVVVFFVIAEGYFAVFNPQIFDNPSFTQSDETLGWVNKPSVNVTIATQEFQVPVKINSKGLRDREYEYKKPEGINRIVVLGDSFTWGCGVEEKKIFTEVLEDNLLEKFQVINMGVIGYSNAQELLTLMNEGIKYNPNIVIVAFCIQNDIRDNVKSINKHMFILNNNTELILTNVPISRKRDDADTQNDLLASSEKFLRKHSHAYNFLYGRLLSSPFGKNLMVNLLTKLGLAEEYGQYNCIFSNTYTPEVQYNWNLTKAILKEIDTVAKENDAKTLIVLIPMQIHVNAELWEKSVRQFGLKTSDYNLSKPNDILVEFGKENNIHVLDLFPEFRKHIESGEQLYFYKDGHWNPTGHKYAAELIYDKLIEEELISLGGE
ncbi:MAG: SGNH/GDSL hydrolase family protein [Methanophagales archaeon]|nr:SGNH/GDSL hydrolase family protein [Methanophagales archaeon]